MRTMFGRLFGIFAAVLLFGMLLLGSSFRAILKGYLGDQKETSLRSTAQAVADLTAAYQSAGVISGENAWQLRMELSLSAEISGADAYVCDSQGTILICSQDGFSCEHVGLTVDPSYLAAVEKNGYYCQTGLVPGLYDDQRYVVAAPITGSASQTLGLVLVTAPMAETTKVLSAVTEIFVFVAVIVLLINSTYGRAFKAIRDDEVAAEAMGINLAHHKRLAFIISSFFAGIGGGMMAMYMGTIASLPFKSSLTYEILLIVVIGGIGSITGSVLASFLYIFLSEWLLRGLDAGTFLGITAPAVFKNGFRMAVFSVIIMVVVLFFRKGIMGDKELPDLLKKRQKKAKKEAVQP